MKRFVRSVIPMELHRRGKDNKKGGLSLLILLFSVGFAHAQQLPTPPPIIGWGFDEFHIGGEMLFYPTMGKDSFSMDFIYQYGGYPSMDYLTEPAPVGKDDYSDRRNFRSMLLEAAAHGMKLVYAPKNIFNLWPGRMANSLETYFDFRSDTLSMTDFRQKADTGLGYVSALEWIKDRYVASVTIESSGSSAPDTFKIAGGPRFTVEGVVKGDGAFWNAIGLPDSTTWHDVTATIKASAIPPLMNDSTVLAYINVYRRVVKNDTGCPSCVCRFYTRIGYFPITKAMYVAADTVGFGFKDLTFAINLEDTTRSGSQLWNDELPWFSGGDSTCDALLTRLQASGQVDPNTFRRFAEAEGSDVYYDIHTTRLVPITFLKGRIASHYFEYLNQPYRFNAAYRLDSMFNDHLDRMMQDDTIWSMLAWFPTIDEPHVGTFQLHRILASKIQQRMRYNFPTDQSKWRGIWANTLGSTGTLRTLAGDFDSTAHKPMSVVITHSYPMSTALPSFYANKDSMDPATFEQYFNKYPYDTLDGNGNPTHKPGYDGATYFPSTPEAHALYTRFLVGVNPVDHGSWRDTSVGGLMLKMRINKADVMDCQFKFEYLGRPKIPVYQNIQMAGYPKYKEEGFPGFTGKWDFPGAQPRTPEQITAQGWLTLNTGNQGMMVSDLHTSGPHLGIFTNYGTNPLLPENPRISNDSLYRARMKDYDTLRLDDVRSFLQGPNHEIPKIWLGYKQRFNAIRKITSAIKRLDTLYTKLQYNPAWQISVERSQDPPKSKLAGYPFSAIPLLDSAYTIQADSAVRPDSLGNYTKKLAGGNPVVDSIQHTYLEITHFTFKDPQRNATGERVLLLTNKRTWPIDWDHSTDSTRYWDGNYGLGAIDVRLPVLRLKNSTGVVADSFIIERVGEPYAWRDTGAFGHDLQLQWLEPGWGAMYCVTPLSSGVSDYGTSFSNAVRSLKVHDRQFIVFERDSAIYLRTIDPKGAWIPNEWRISEAADTTNIAESGYLRAANNMYPAIGKSFDANSLMVVWERKNNSTGTSTVEACRLDTLPITTTLPDTTRRRLAAPVTLTAPWMRLMPSIVGLSDSGYVVSWSCAPLKGITVVAVRNKKNFSTSTDVSQAQVAYAKASDPDVGFVVDTNAWHSTVAHVPKKGSRLYPGIPGGTKGGRAQDDVPWQYAHLAYQQGTPDQANSQFIFYNLVYARTVGTGKPIVNLALTEHVSKGLDGCGFLHPCIAADSARIGVAFQLNTAKNRYVVLRFRDSLDTKGNVATDTNGNQLRAWTTPAYKWGGEFWLLTTFPPTSPVPIKPVYFERPSLTEFPSSAKLSMDGGLSWVWTNLKEIPGMGQHTGVMLYRYGWKQMELMTFGHYPTMTLAPTATENGFVQTSIFHRGDTMQRFWREHPSLDSVRYYPSLVVNTPAEKNALFSATPATRNIHSFVNLVRPEEYCNGWLFGGGIGHNWIDGTPEHPPTPPGGMPPGGIPTGGIPAPPTGYPGLPPGFFQPPGGITTTTGTRITTLEEAEYINRTSVFTASTHSVSIRRVVLRNDGLQAWLAAAPFDSARNAPANIYLLTELVRASDSAVLWRGDTVTATSLDTVLQEEMVEVPVQLVATPGTGVFLRLRTEASAGLQYEVESGFHFGQRFGTAAAMPKRQWYRQGSQGPATGEAMIAVEVRPNPTEAGMVSLRLQTGEAGVIRLGLYTLLGEQVAALPDVELRQAGVTVQQVDFSNLPAGIYLLVAEQGQHKTSAKVTVVGE